MWGAALELVLPGRGPEPQTSHVPKTTKVTAKPKQPRSDKQQKPKKKITKPKQQTNGLADEVLAVIKNFLPHWKKPRRSPRIGLDQAKRALLPLVLVPAEKIPECLCAVARARRWSNPTLVSRVNKMLALPRLVLAQTRAENAIAVLKQIRREALMIQEPAWNPSNPTALLTTQQAQTLWKRLANEPEKQDLIAPILLAFLFAQRVGDVLLWRTANIHHIARSERTKDTISILVVEGKTVARTGPYALQCWAESETAKLLLRLKTSRAHRPYLFLPAPALYQDHRRARTEAQKAQHQIRRECPTHLWGPRRGAAVALGTLSCTEESVSTLTRHPATATLRRYMAAGLMSNSEGFTQADTQRQLEAALLSGARSADINQSPLV